MLPKLIKALLITLIAGCPVWSQLQFVPVTPCRVTDTRNPTGPFGGPTMAANSSRSFAVPRSVCGIPATAEAYSLNVTVVPQGPLPFLTLWPTGQNRPTVSTLNSFSGDVVANAAIVPAGTDGAVSVYVVGQTDVILDINGYFSAPASNGSSYSFYPATPCRVVDTRGGAGQFGGPEVAGGQVRDFPLPLTSCDIPAIARGYSLNATVVPDGYLGFLTAWPTGQDRPNASNLNSWKGKIVANAALVPAGTNESISVYVSNPTQVILDINGYFGQPGHAGALSFYPVAPCRVADTRNSDGPFGGPEMGASQTRAFPIPASVCGIPTTATAYSVNVTVVPDQTLAYLSLWPFGSARPNVSTLNSFDGRIVANAAIVPAGAGGGVSVYVTDKTHVILDIDGYFADSTGSGGAAPGGYTVTGMASGLTSGASVVLLDNGADALTVSANGSFTFPTALASGANYAVTVGTQPAGENCQVTNGGPGAITADVTNVVVTCTPTRPPDHVVAERALAQTGLSIALASIVLQSQVQVMVTGGTQSAACHGLTGGGSVNSGATPTATSNGHPIYPVTVYYDDQCSRPYIAADVTSMTQTGDGSGDLTETATYYGLHGATLGTMLLNETIVETITANSIVSVSVHGLGSFTPASGQHLPIQLGLSCVIPFSTQSSMSIPCTGAVAQDFPALELAIGSVTSITLQVAQSGSSQANAVTFTGGGSMSTGPMAGLTVTNPSAGSFVIEGGTPFGTTSTSGSSAQFALFPPTPLSWTLSDSAHDQKLTISLIDNTSRTLSLVIQQVSTGKSLVTGSLDQSGTGTITYSDGSSATITNWTLAD